MLLYDVKHFWNVQQYLLGCRFKWADPVAHYVKIKNGVITFLGWPHKNSGSMWVDPVGRWVGTDRSSSSLISLVRQRRLRPPPWWRQRLFVDLPRALSLCFSVPTVNLPRVSSCSDGGGAFLPVCTWSLRWSVLGPTWSSRPALAWQGLPPARWGQ
jgi:hypothetical protein